MQELRDLARKLLADGTVQVVVGYEVGPRGARPTFVTRPEEADRLVFDHRCAQNLASYLAPKRSHVLGLGKRAVVVKGCDARSVAGLIRESQVKREDVVVIGVRCGGVSDDPACAEPLGDGNLSDRCRGCTAREPKLADHVVGPPVADPPGKSHDDELIAKLDAMTPEERFEFWSKELERCVRCHACREVCPMCFCNRCLADKSQPQWIESSPHLRGNFAWHMSRAMHQAGRCCDCGECDRVCPAEIPLRLLNRKLAMVCEERFDFRVGDDPEQPAPIGSYKLDDGQEFIR
jgi:ferredoxin